MPIMQPDLLCSLDRLKIELGVVNDTSRDFALLPMIARASAMITRSCNRPWWLWSNPNNPSTWYGSGQGDEFLILPAPPMQTPILTGNTIAGSPTITNLASPNNPIATAGLFVNQSVCGPTLQTGSTILSIDSPTQITLQNVTTPPVPAGAALTATGVQLFCGVAVWEDDLGYWNTPQGSFATNNTPQVGTPAVQTQLVEGVDYSYERSRFDPSESDTATLVRMNNVWWQQFRTGGYLMLSVNGAGGRGNIKVQYASGFKFVPYDIEEACIRTVAKIWNSRRIGQQLSSETHPSYSYSVAGGKGGGIDMGLLGGDVGAILATYRLNAVCVDAGN
jgi:hypothetical protein